MEILSRIGERGIFLTIISALDTLLALNPFLSGFSRNSLRPHELLRCHAKNAFTGNLQCRLRLEGAPMADRSSAFRAYRGLDTSTGESPFGVVGSSSDTPFANWGVGASKLRNYSIVGGQLNRGPLSALRRERLGLSRAFSLCRRMASGE
jgi:hypothetical protein